MSLLVDQLHPLVLNVGLAEHNADWNWKDISSPFMRLYYVTEGTAQIVLPTGTHLLQPHRLYFIPSFTRHSYICEKQFSHYYLHIYEELQQEAGILDEWELPVEVPADPLALALMQRLCEMNPNMTLPISDPAVYDNNPTLMRNLLINKQRPFHDKVESRGIVFQLLSYFLRHARLKEQNHDKRISDALTYIRKHIYEEINLDLLARQACLSKDHFIRLFRRETGSTPLQYINRRKMEKAQLMLLTDDMPVKNVAFTLAFDDYSYFNRLFKKLTGTTPQAYRSRCH